MGSAGSSADDAEERKLVLGKFSEHTLVGMWGEIEAGDASCSDFSISPGESNKCWFSLEGNLLPTVHCSSGYVKR